MWYILVMNIARPTAAAGKTFMGAVMGDILTQTTQAVIGRRGLIAIAAVSSGQAIGKTLEEAAYETVGTIIALAAIAAGSALIKRLWPRAATTAFASLLLMASAPISGPSSINGAIPPAYTAPTELVMHVDRNNRPLDRGLKLS